MAETEWTPLRGWVKVAIYVPIRMAIGLAVIVGLAWALSAVLTSLEVEYAPVVFTALLGVIAGFVAGAILCVKLSDSVGHAGRTILPTVGVAIVAMYGLAFRLIPAVTRLGPVPLIWFVSASLAATLLIVLRVLWVEG